MTKEDKTEIDAMVKDMAVHGKYTEDHLMTEVSERFGVAGIIHAKCAIRAAHSDW
jgi:hypothetical protein